MLVRTKLIILLYLCLVLHSQATGANPAEERAARTVNINSPRFMTYDSLTYISLQKNDVYDWISSLFGDYDSDESEEYCMKRATLPLSSPINPIYFSSNLSQLHGYCGPGEQHECYQSASNSCTYSECSNCCPNGESCRNYTSCGGSSCCYNCCRSACPRCSLTNVAQAV